VVYFVTSCVVVLLSLFMRSRTSPVMVIDHVTFFSLGFLYYWMSPLLMSDSAYLKDIFNELGSVFEQIPQTTIILYFSLCFIFFFSYMFGAHIGQRWNIRNKPRLNYDRGANGLLAFIFAALVIYYIFSFRDQLFQGYTIISNIDMQAKGQFVATSLCILVLATIRFFDAHIKDAELGYISKKIWNKYFTFYFIVALLILSLGGRLSSLLMILHLRHTYVKPIKARALLTILISFVVLFSILGVIRSGGIASDMKSILFVFFAEPIFTSYSLFSYLAYNDLVLFQFPIMLLSDLLNLIPTVLLPEKANLLIYPVDIGLIVQAPQGAMNSFVSFTANFGVLGTIVVLFMFGCFMEVLRKKKTDVSLTIYFMLCYCIPFSFFRDDFQVSIVKNMLEFSVIIPLLYLFVTRFLSSSRRGGLA
jgi:hypothetical protein